MLAAIGHALMMSFASAVGTNGPPGITALKALIPNRIRVGAISNVLVVCYSGSHKRRGVSTLPLCGHL